MTSKGLDKLPLIEPHKVMQSVQLSASGLSGPTYSVTGHAGKFKLPPAKTLRPGIDYHSGDLDSWPVHALKSTRSNLSLGQHTSLSPHTASSFHKAPIFPKPKFLEQLESYLNKELRLLGCPPIGPHELRLQAHREVFEYLIEDFKTYKELLSAIKNEYELYLEYQDQLIKELKPMRSLLEIVREECERKILAMKEEGKREEAEVRQENKKLTATIDRMRVEELSFKSQIEKLQNEVAKLYESFRQESDARKILVTDYNDLKFRQQDQKTEDDGALGEGEDPVVLKLKLVRAREDLRISNQRINSMLADYGDVVPRREFELMETSCRNLETELETIKTDHTSLMEEHSALQELSKDLQSQRDKLSEEIVGLKRSATPRPEWARCGLYMEGGIEKWKETMEGRSSDRMLDAVLAQLAGIDESEVAKGEAFAGQGLGSDVPHYLQWEGQVKNRKISQKELNQLINGFWHHRLSSSQDPPLSLDEDLYLFLSTRRNNNKELAIEDGYNLHSGCSRFSHELHIALFRQIIEEELEEDVFHHWLHLQTSLTEAFSQQQIGQGIVNIDIVPHLLESVLTAKPAENLKVLTKQAIELGSINQDSVSFTNLLTPDLNGRPSDFSLLLLEQYQRESEAFMGEIAREIADQENVSLLQLQSIIQKIDASKSYEDQLLLLSKAFSVSLDVIVDGKTELQEITMPTEKLLHKLKKICPHRSGQKQT